MPQSIQVPQAVYGKLPGQKEDFLFVAYSPVLNDYIQNWRQLSFGEYPPDTRKYGLIVQESGALLGGVGSVSKYKDGHYRRIPQVHYFLVSREDAVSVGYNLELFFKTISIQDHQSLNHQLPLVTISVDTETIFRKQINLLERYIEDEDFWFLLQLVLEQQQVLIQGYETENREGQSDLAGLLFRLLPKECRIGVSVGFDVTKPNDNKCRLQFLAAQLPDEQKIPGTSYLFTVNNSGQFVLADRDRKRYLETWGENELRYAWLLSQFVHLCKPQLEGLLNFIEDLPELVTNNIILLQNGNGLSSKADELITRAAALNERALSSIYQKGIAFQVLERVEISPETIGTIASLACQAIEQERVVLDAEQVKYCVESLISAIQLDSSLFHKIDILAQLYVGVLASCPDLARLLERGIASLFLTEDINVITLEGVITKWRAIEELFSSPLYIECAVNTLKQYIIQNHSTHKLDRVFKQTFQWIGPTGFIPLERISAREIKSLISAFSHKPLIISDKVALESYKDIICYLFKAQGYLDGVTELVEYVPDVKSYPDVQLIIQLEHTMGDDLNQPINDDILRSALALNDSERFLVALRQALYQVASFNGSPDLFTVIQKQLIHYEFQIPSDLLGQVAAIYAHQNNHSAMLDIYRRVKQTNKDRVTFGIGYLNMGIHFSSNNALTLLSILLDSLDPIEREEYFRLLISSETELLHRFAISRLELALYYFKTQQASSPDVKVKMGKWLWDLETLESNRVILLLEYLRELEDNVTRDLFQYSTAEAISIVLMTVISKYDPTDFSEDFLEILLTNVPKNSVSKFWNHITTYIKHTREINSFNWLQTLKRAGESYYGLKTPIEFENTMNGLRLQYGWQILQGKNYRALKEFTEHYILSEVPEDKRIALYPEYVTTVIENKIVSDESTRQIVVDYFEDMLDHLHSQWIQNIEELLLRIAGIVSSVLPENARVLQKLVNQNAQIKIHYKSLSQEIGGLHFADVINYLLSLAVHQANSEIIESLIDITINSLSSGKDTYNILQKLDTSFIDSFQPEFVAQCFVKLYQDDSDPSVLISQFNHIINQEWSDKPTDNEKILIAPLIEANILSTFGNTTLTKLLKNASLSTFTKLRLLWLITKDLKVVPDSTMDYYKTIFDAANLDNCLTPVESTAKALKAIAEILNSRKSNLKFFWEGYARIGFLYCFKNELDMNLILNDMEEQLRNTSNLPDLLWKGLESSTNVIPNGVQLSLTAFLRWLDRYENKATFSTMQLQRAALVGLLGEQIALELHEYVSHRLRRISRLITSIQEEDREALKRLPLKRGHTKPTIKVRYQKAFKDISERRLSFLPATTKFMEILAMLGELNDK